MDDSDTRGERRTANPGYAAFQVARALTTAEQHGDPATRARARERVAKWAAVLQGMATGALAVGSRTPLADVPGWATPEVVTGGFATGQLLAGGSLLDHERALLEQLSAGSAPEPRRVLNAYFLTDEGLGRLGECLKSGHYEVAVPEEGALPVVAWLTAQGHVEAARRLLDEIAPFFDRLRFYPVPTERAAGAGTRVFLQDVGHTVGDLERIRPNERIEAQKEAIQVWAPLYDRVVSLFLETVDGEIPTLVAADDGKPLLSADKRHAITGGWPCRRYAADWATRAREALEAYRRERQDHTRCGKPDRRKENFPQLRDCLQRCADDPNSLTGRDVGRIRLILARYVAKRGAPDSARCTETRAAQRRNASRPTFHELAGIVVQRLGRHPRDGGLEDPSVLAHPVTADEASRSNVAGGTAIPPPLEHKLQRCLVESVDVLVQRGIITSGETLAHMLPQVTSNLRAAGIAEPGLRRLHAAIYRAFRKRRSLLLLNLESQVRIEELPWVAATDGFRRDDLPAQDLARQTLEDMAILALSSFPYAIIPNKLLQELRALATTAKLDLPLVDEVAADIFMGRFSAKFREAARRAADLLEGTLYAAYYGIGYRQLDRLLAPARPGIWRWFWRAAPKPETDAFAELCASRAGVALGGWEPAVNGMIIEQQQILTSQNLAVLFDALRLTDRLGDQLEDLARACFMWVCRRLQAYTTRWHADLIKVKNAAYVWRQMIFFLAMLPNDRIKPFLSWAEAHLEQQPAGFRTRLGPALRGLALAADGRSLDEPSAVEAGARRFLGWSKEKHWLIQGPDDRDHGSEK